ncbi:UNVERIFIED_ORG: uncharacterized protein DUF3558 [Nocardia globerula]|uniref:Uncharacterized protein DUF3558 n=1 Tax=Nocardia globerula TaxID=1818 RepID=A0A652YZH6_NOCGL|nr:uncharacterized protein DUF3558 [Rhodococcus globerulus]
MRPWGACLSVSVVALLGGCSSTVVGEAYPVDSIGMFDPCAVLSHDELLNLGVDPGTQEADLFNTHIDGFNVCSWFGPEYYLGLTSTKYTLDDVKANPEYRDFSSGSVAGREVLIFLDAADVESAACNLVFATVQSTAMIRIDKKFGEPQDEEPCALVERVAQTVVRLLP